MPRSARLFLDAEELNNPYSARRAADQVDHVLRAEAKGFAAKTIELGAFRNAVDLELTLEPQPAPKLPVAASPSSSRAPALSAPRPPACDSPFYRDGDGIMHLKPECAR
jgi:hypothetical protein